MSGAPPGVTEILRRREDLNRLFTLFEKSVSAAVVGFRSESGESARGRRNAFHTTARGPGSTGGGKTCRGAAGDAITRRGNA